MPLLGLESFTLKNRSRLFQMICGLLLAVSTLTLSSCSHPIYYYTQYNFAGRVVPPSGLLQRVMVGTSIDGGVGTLNIIDGLRDIRSNVQNTIHSFQIAGYATGFPNLILDFPEQLRGYVWSSTTGGLSAIDYSKENVGASSNLPANAAIAISETFNHYYAATENAGQWIVIDNTTQSPSSYALNIANVFQTVVNQGDTVALAMVRNSSTIYRLVKLNPNQANPPGAVDCQPYNLPLYCAIPVVGTFDHPIGAYFSADGTTVYILNAGPEYGGTTASVTFLQQGPLNVNSIPTASPDTSAFIANVPVPGGVTAAISDGTTLYVSGQQRQSDGLFAGRLSTINLATLAVTGSYSISDGNHSKMLFADDNTLWIGSQACAVGERQHQASLGVTTQAANYNCLTRFDLGAKTASIVPAITPGGATTVPYPNQNADPYYYGDLTGICWVQNYHKVYTAYGGQVHAFNTPDGSEINNFFITVQGTALDVAYMDALTNSAD